MKHPSHPSLPSDTPLWAAEPFRVFFPLGILAGFLGVLIWPLFYAEVWPFAPHLQHPRLMFLGFGFAFVTGFLGTAWPRFLETLPLSRAECLALILSWSAMLIAYLLHRLPIGDACFAIHGLLLMLILGIRLRRSGEWPPPGFSLAFVGLASTTLVSAFWAWRPALTDPFVHQFTRLLIWQGSLLLPLLGVGSYLFPRFFLQPGASKPAVQAPNRALGVWLSAAFLVASFGLEASGWIRSGNGVRLAALGIWAWMAAPAVLRGPAPTTRAWALRMALGSIALTFLIRTFWLGPAQAIPHLLFVAGFGLSLLLVADRVTLGHCTNLSSVEPRSRFWRWLVWLGLLAAATRASSDFKASIQVSHHIYAALLWAAVLLAWARMHAPLWHRQPTD